MVQVIDPPSAPWIADYDRVFWSKTWTGRVLVPCDPWMARKAIPPVTGAVGFVLLLAEFGLTLRMTPQSSEPMVSFRAIDPAAASCVFSRRRSLCPEPSEFRSWSSAHCCAPRPRTRLTRTAAAAL